MLLDKAHCPEHRRSPCPQHTLTLPTAYAHPVHNIRSPCTQHIKGSYRRLRKICFCCWTRHTVLNIDADPVHNIRSPCGQHDAYTLSTTYSVYPVHNSTLTLYTTALKQIFLIDAYQKNLLLLLDMAHCPEHKRSPCPQHTLTLSTTYAHTSHSIRSPCTQHIKGSYRRLRKICFCFSTRHTVLNMSVYPEVRVTLSSTYTLTLHGHSIQRLPCTQQYAHPVHNSIKADLIDALEKSASAVGQGTLS